MTERNAEKTHRRQPTSYDVARHAGVSQSAVSRCFKPGASVSKKMRERVMKSVRELGYTPNAIARGLITRRSNMVAVIISNLNFYPEVLSELSNRFTERGVHVLLFTLDYESDVSRVLDQVWQYQVDGVIAAAHLEQGQIEQFAERQIPLVFYNRSYQDVPVSSVCCDQVEGERMLVTCWSAAGSTRASQLSAVLPIPLSACSARVAPSTVCTAWESAISRRRPVTTATSPGVEPCSRWSMPGAALRMR